MLVSAAEGSDLSTFTPASGTSNVSPKPAALVYRKIVSVKDAQTASLVKQSEAGYMLSGRI